MGINLFFQKKTMPGGREGGSKGEMVKGHNFPPFLTPPLSKVLCIPMFFWQIQFQKLAFPKRNHLPYLKCYVSTNFWLIIELVQNVQKERENLKLILKVNFRNLFRSCWGINFSAELWLVGFPCLSEDSRL